MVRKSFSSTSTVANVLAALLDLPDAASHLGQRLAQGASP
jgi:hypothetical protein